MRDFYKFAEEALEKAGKVGERKRKSRREEAGALASARMAELERAETGATRRLGMKEAGLGRRLEMEQAFAKPYQEAETGRSRARGELRKAEAEKIGYGTEFERGTRGTLEDILKSRGRQAGAGAREAELGVSEMERDIRLRDEAQAKAAIPSATELEVPEEPAKSRRMNPLLRKALAGGPLSESSPFSPSPLLAPQEGWGEFYKTFLGRPAKEVYKWAFPEVK